MSIRRLVEIVLDRAAAKRVEDDAKRTLDRGTDPRTPTRNLNTVGSALRGLTSIARTLGVALGAAFVIRKIQQFGREAIAVATEARGVWNRLAGQLAVAGVAYEDVREEITANARAMQDATTVADEDFATILQELLSTTNDYARSLQEVGTVANLAAAKQIDLKTVAQLVGRAMVGQTGTLSRYGIIVQEGADVMEVLRERFAGMAANEARSLEGQLAQLNNEWADFKEAVGNAMIEAGGGTSILQTLTGTVKGLADWVDINRGKIVGWAGVFTAAMRAAFESVNVVVRTLFNFGQIIGSVMSTAGAHIRQGVGTAVNEIVELLNKLPGVDIDFRINTLTTREFEQRNAELRDAIVRDAADMADAVLDLGQAYRDLGQAAADAATGQAAAGATSGPTSLNVTGPGVIAGAAREVPELGLHLPTIEARLQDIRATYAAGWFAMKDDLAAANPLAGLVEQTEVTAAFMREGFKGVGAAIVNDLIAGRAQHEVASGLAALAAGLWPPNPAALAASTKHFAAAAAFRALGSSIAGGGGGSGLGSPGGAIGSSRPTAGSLPGTEVNIFIDPLSPADARFQRVALGAVQEAQDRFGDVRLNIHSRTGA